MIDWIDYETASLALLGLFVLIGFVFLSLGGDQLTRGASNFAAICRVNPVVVGLTVVSMATSMPEFFTSFTSVVNGQDGLAMGNILGSNLANIGLILGLSALVYPVVIQARLIRWEAPFLVAVTLLFSLLCYDGILSRLDGVLMLFIMAPYLYFLVKNARDSLAQVSEEVTTRDRSVKHLTFSFGMIGFGAALLLLGSELLVTSATEIATRFGVSEVVIGFTLVAIGTSLPELAASLAAVAKKEVELLAGNIIGSNLFNLMFIGGGVSLMKTIKVEKELFTTEFPAMIIACLFMWAFFVHKRKVSRSEGGILLLLYTVSLYLLTRNAF